MLAVGLPCLSLTDFLFYSTLHDDVFFLISYFLQVELSANTNPEGATEERNNSKSYRAAIKKGKRILSYYFTNTGESYQFCVKHFMPGSLNSFCDALQHLKYYCSTSPSTHTKFPLQKQRLQKEILVFSVDNIVSICCTFQRKATKALLLCNNFY